MPMRLVLCLCALFGLVACVGGGAKAPAPKPVDASNPFSLHYYGKSREALAQLPGVVFCDKVDVRPLREVTYPDMLLDAFEEGYTLIGQSSGVGAWGDEGRHLEAGGQLQAQAAAKGKELGACLAIWEIRYIRGEPGVATGDNDTRYLYQAFYFAKYTLDEPGLVVEEAPLTAEQADVLRKKMPRLATPNRPALVKAVALQGMGGRAGVMRQDILLQINGKTCASGEIKSLLQPGENAFTVLRAGKIYTLHVDGTTPVPAKVAKSVN